MTKDEALSRWDEKTRELEELKARHKREMEEMKRAWAEARDAFVDASNPDC